MKYFLTLCFFCLFSLAAFPGLANQHEIVDEQEQARAAWTILLAHANQKIPMVINNNGLIYWNLLPVKNREVSYGTCIPSYMKKLAKGKAKRIGFSIKDLLASRLAYLKGGRNEISGLCLGSSERECFVKVLHEDGEDVFGMEIRFKVSNQKIDMESLFCNITP